MMMMTNTTSHHPGYQCVLNRMIPRALVMLVESPLSTHDHLVDEMPLRESP